MLYYCCRWLVKCLDKQGSISILAIVFSPCVQLTVTSLPWKLQVMMMMMMMMIIIIIIITIIIGNVSVSPVEAPEHWFVHISLFLNPFGNKCIDEIIRKIVTKTIIKPVNSFTRAEWCIDTENRPTNSWSLPVKHVKWTLQKNRTALYVAVQHLAMNDHVAEIAVYWLVTYSQHLTMAMC